MTGSAPLSPLRMRLSRIRAYSPTDPAISSGDAVVAAISSAWASESISEVVTAPFWGSVSVIAQPSSRRSPSSAGASAPRVRWVAPVVIRSTADAVS